MLKITDNIKLGKLVGSSGSSSGSGGNSGGGSQFPSDRMEDIDTSSLISGSFEYTTPADGWFFIDQYTNAYNIYGNITYNDTWLGNFTVGTKVLIINKEVNINGTKLEIPKEIINEGGGEYQRIEVPKGAVISLSPSETLNENSTLPNAWFIYSQNNS